MGDKSSDEEGMGRKEFIRHIGNRLEKSVGGENIFASTLRNEKIGRRKFLQMTGAGIGAIGLAAFTPDIISYSKGARDFISDSSPENSVTGMATERHGINFQTVLNAVDDLGMDNSGSEPIDSQLEGALESGNVLIEFPPGRYRLDGNIQVSNSSNIGIRGTGSSIDDTVIFAGGANHEINLEGGDNHLVENLTFDETDGDGWIGFVDDIDAGTMEYRDLKWVGFKPDDNGPGESNVQSLLRAHVQDEGGVANVINVTRKGPSRLPPYPDGASYIYSGTDMHGTLNIEDCHFENSTSHALYCTQSPGTINVRNCFFKNNNGWQIRASSKNGVVENCTVVFDIEDDHPDNVFPEDEFPSMRSAIWCVNQSPEAWFEGTEGGTYRDIDIIVKNLPENAPIQWIIRHDGAQGPATFENIRIHSEEDSVPHGYINANARTILATNPGNLKDKYDRYDSNPPWPEHTTTIRGCSFTGVAPPNMNDGKSGVIDVMGREATIENCCIDVGTDRPGIRVGNDLRFNKGGYADITGPTAIDTNGQSVKTIEEGTVGTNETTSNPSCSQASEEGGGTGSGTGGGTGEDPIGSTDGWTTITFSSTSGRTNYIFKTTGLIEKSDANGATIGETDAIFGNKAKGFVQGGKDSYRFKGKITELYAGENIQTQVNGETVGKQELLNRIESCSIG